MEDIEDLLAGGVGGAPPGFRLPLNAVGINPKTNKSKRISSKPDQITASNRDSLAPPSMKIPGTQVTLLSRFHFLICFGFCIYQRFCVHLHFVLMIFRRRYTSRRLDVLIIRRVILWILSALILIL